VLRVLFNTAETSFDPQWASDAASDSIIENIYEAMLDYDYLARPLQLVPRTLEAMPTVQDNGATYVFRVRKGIYFTPDPGVQGETARADRRRSRLWLKRLLDPAVKSPWRWLIESRIVGADEAREKAAKTGRFDYDARIAGLEVVDRYTLRIRLIQPDLRFLYALAVPNTAAVAREVVEKYGSISAAIRWGRGRSCSANTSAARRSCSSPIPTIGTRRMCRLARCRRSPAHRCQRSRARSFRS
jgi:ABC-type transport system substrate-binding protein